ncbi:MAG TPA: EAL domain-containing protein [Gemmatimonadales bacterium]|nr:EAL domain-containing protein [Gemmatimonadales bacterium]
MLLVDQLLAPGGLVATFQPIIRIAGSECRVEEVEGLVRGAAGTNAARSAVLFEYARRKRIEPQIDRACTELVCRSAAPIAGRGVGLSINVHAATLARDAEFPEFLLAQAAEAGFPGDHLTVELVEHSSHWNREGALAAIDRLRGAGVRIALDDVGRGHSNIDLLLDVRPDVVKLDRYFVLGASQCEMRRAVLASFRDMAAGLGAVVVAEGVETAEDLATVVEAGVVVVQGWYFGHPVASVADAASPYGVRQLPAALARDPR